MRLRRLSLLLFILSTLLTFAGALLKIKAIGPPAMSSYLLGGGISLLMAAFIGLYLAPQPPVRRTTDAAPVDETLELPDPELHPRENETLRQYKP